MRFGIVANPKSGAASMAHKRLVLERAATILGDCAVTGLDTKGKDEFLQCAVDLAGKVEVLIVAGGDGTFSDVINTLPPEKTLSYMPLGSGCAMRYALDLPPQISRVAPRIRDGREHRLDLISCDGSTKAFMTSVGFEGSILHRREALQHNGIRGPHAYAMATLGYFFGNVERTRLTITADDETLDVPDAVTVIVTKIAYYGYGMKIVPDARFDDGYLHLLAVNSPLPEIVQNMATSFFVENRLGIYKKARQITVDTDAERYLQTDGSIYRKGTTFRFEVIERGLRMWY